MIETDFYTCKQVQEALGISRSGIYRLLASGLLTRKTLVGIRHLYITKESADALLKGVPQGKVDNSR